MLLNIFQKSYIIIALRLSLEIARNYLNGFFNPPSTASFFCGRLIHRPVLFVSMSEIRKKPRKTQGMSDLSFAKSSAVAAEDLPPHRRPPPPRVRRAWWEQLMQFILVFQIGNLFALFVGAGLGVCALLWYWNLTIPR